MSVAVSNERASPWGTSMFIMMTDTLEANETLAVLPRLIGQARQVRLRSWCVSVVVVSHDTAFLTTFAESSLKGRLLVWATRLLVVTSLTLPQLHALLPAHWTFSMMNTIFLNLEDTPSSLRYNLYTYLPYSPGGAQVVKVAIWSSKRGGVLTGISLFPEKYPNFHAAKMNTTALPWPPYWDEVEVTTRNGTIIKKCTGSDYLAFKATSEALNFTFNILPINTWEEGTRMLTQRKIFIVPVHYIIFPERVKRIDFTYIYEFVQATFSMAKPSLKPRWQSLYYPLTNLVWIAVLVALLLMPVIFYVQTFGRMKRCVRLSVETVALEVAGILVGQNLPLRLSNVSSSRLLLAVWLVFAFIIGTVYRSNLIAALTLPKYPPRPETLEQMVDVVDMATMPQYGEAWRTFFAASESQVYKRLAKLMVLGPGAREGLQMAVQQNVASLNGRRYMANMIAEHFTQVDGSTPLYLGQESIFPGPAGWALPHDAPYKPQVDRCLMAIIEAGLYEKWSEESLSETRRRSQQRMKKYLAQQQLLESSGDKTHPGSRITALTFTHMQGPLLLICATLAVAGMTFIGEIFIIRHTGIRARAVQ
ncbi:ionotropic receptor 93a-like [Panulirus ornatus]|uniref:ionotropic receptor 93a-like n=1 Tax=Panulirus ornatus TaxID=150431 RepID=UPI003A88D9D4